ncbi:MAG: tRNA (adenosine(37)-N6)-threonylcarbamoyltransferase complex ATPase subunit type 1 TsaE [Bacteroidales bacterium]|nr:tRNA (adenosine(37)-N6)-threonylcarbamoyltransferase complex ATPase subunit type 1 TsaE [Bacteroidales bacterium]
MEDFLCETTDDLPQIARTLLRKYTTERIFALRGAMGSGKTTFMQAIAKELHATDSVSSPTFAIVNEYRSDDVPIYHFDFYRIKNLREAIDVGLDDYLYGDGYCFLEWAENIEELLPEDTINVYITVNENQSRTFSF